MPKLDRIHKMVVLNPEYIGKKIEGSSAADSQERNPGITESHERAIPETNYMRDE